MQRYIDFLVWQNPTLHRNDLWRPFRSSYIRRFSRNGQIRKSQLSNILAVYKRLKTEICRNLTNSHNPKKNTGAFSPESRESIKTNEPQRDSAQRFTMALRAVFSPHHAVRAAPAPHGPKRKPIPISHADSSQRPTPQDHRSIEAQKNSRENENNGPLSRVSPPLNRETSPFCSPRVNTAGEAFAPPTRTYALTEFRLFAFTLHRPPTTHTISTIFG